MSKYDFTAGLAKIEQLEALIASPWLKLLADTLPVRPHKTKPTLADPAALVVVGAATVIFGSDRAATRELRAHWSRLRAAFERNGYRVPFDPLQAHNSRDYRDGVLGGEFPPAFKELAKSLAGGQAIEMGIFPDIDSPWGVPRLEQILSADGTRFKTASSVRCVDDSRSTKGGPPRIVEDGDPSNKYGWHYNFCILSARGENKRQRVILDVVHAPGGDEMAVVVPAVLRLKGMLGDRMRCFVYDGAMHGKHHHELRLGGLLTVNTLSRLLSSHVRPASRCQVGSP